MKNNYSIFWNEEVINSIENSDIDLIAVYDNTYISDENSALLKTNKLQEVNHCDWCGHAIKYVSVLKFNNNSNISHYQIGKECLTKLDNVEIRGLNNVSRIIEREIKKLKKNASIRKRKERYSRTFKDEINKVNSIIKNNPDISNSFIRDMLHYMTTGEKMMSQKMIDGVNNFINRNQIFLNAKKTEEFITERNKKLKPLFDKIDSLLHIIFKIDNLGYIDNNRKDKYVIVNKRALEERWYTSFFFIRDLKKQLETKYILSERQVSAMNKVFFKYKQKQEELTKYEKEKESNVEIPF